LHGNRRQKSTCVNEQNLGSMARMQLATTQTTFELDSGTIAGALAMSVPEKVDTPARVHLPLAGETNFAQLAEAVGGVPSLRAAYSVKTNPRDEMIALALRHGIDVEVISEAEWRHVRSRGFEPSRILYNGPRPLGDAQVAVAFADSTEAFERNAARYMGMAHGIRIRPAGISSRFGVPAAGLRGIAGIARKSPRVAALGVSFFVRSQDLRGRPWADVARGVVLEAAKLEEDAAKPVIVFDAGGGCSPAEFDERWATEFRETFATAQERLRFVERSYIEPGQEVAAPTEAVIVRVLEVRRSAPRADVVIDAGLPAMPRVREAGHRVFLRSRDAWTQLRSGGDRILGCICMEEDVVKEGVSVADVREGDVIAICDTGAYDSSMAFDFAKGRSKPEEP
jgi:diaminopimelate decarboxylase